MLSIATTTRIFFASAPTDMRKSFDGLFALAESVIEEDPLSGHLFLFRNRNRDRVKILYWDKDGLAIWYKRLEKGTFQFPTDFQDVSERPAKVEIDVSELAMLLGGIDLRDVKRRPRYRIAEGK